MSLGINTKPLESNFHNLAQERTQSPNSRIHVISPKLNVWDERDGEVLDTAESSVVTTDDSKVLAVISENPTSKGRHFTYSNFIAVVVLGSATLSGGSASADITPVTSQDAYCRSLYSAKLKVTAEDSESVPKWRAKIEARVQELLNLSDNWDGYGSPAPTDDAAENAGVLFDALAQADFEPTGVAPAAEGGVVIVFFRGSKRAEVEFPNSGGAIIGMDDGVGYPQVWELSADAKEVEASLNRIREFICG